MILVTGLVPATADGQAFSQASSRVTATRWDPQPAADIVTRLDQLRGRVAAVRTTANAASVRCVDCDAQALTFHVALVDGNVNWLGARARADSTNFLCGNCTSIAAAYQVVVAGPGVSLRNAPPGLRQALDTARTDIAALTGDEENLVEIADEIAADLQAAVLDAYVPPMLLRTLSASPASPVDVKVLRDVDRD